jgi:hypothetical protein
MLANNTKKPQHKYFSTLDYTDQINQKKNSYISLSKSEEARCHYLVVPSLSQPLELPPEFNKKSAINGHMYIRESNDLPTVAYQNNKQMAVLVRSHLN